MYQGDHTQLIQLFKERTLFFKNECNKDLPTTAGLKFASDNKAIAGADNELLNQKKNKKLIMPFKMLKEKKNKK